MEYITEHFNEQVWKIYLIDDEDDLTDGQAEVLFEKKEIYVRYRDLSYKTIKHELWHVYYAYCYTDSASLEPIQVEEISASLFEDRSEDIEARAKDIYKKLKVLKDVKKEDKE